MMFKKIIVTVFFALNFCSLLSASGIVEVEVREGNTLNEFAQIYLKNPSEWPKIYEINKDIIKDPDRIYPGQVIKVPGRMLREEIGDLIKLRRRVEIEKERGGEWLRAYRQQRLFPGYGIKTGPDSRADIKFLAGGSLEVKENSLIYLKAAQRRTPETSLLGGRLNVSDSVVVTPSAEVRPAAGSKYDIDVDEKNTTRVSVRLGEVAVSGRGETFNVAEGFRTLVNMDEAPQTPAALPLSGEKALQSGKAESRQHIFKIQVSTGRNFYHVIKEEESGELNMNFVKKGLDEGSYFWRYAIVDSEGFRGEYSYPRSFDVGAGRRSILELREFKTIDKSQGIMKVSGFAQNA
ncbi:MAG: LysM peptidoglycan-binding domain-containing protein, partial [Elusimicrobiota bacterium]